MTVVCVWSNVCVESSFGKIGGKQKYVSCISMLCISCMFSPRGGRFRSEKQIYLIGECNIFFVISWVGFWVTCWAHLKNIFQEEVPVPCFCQMGCYKLSRSCEMQLHHKTVLNGKHNQQKNGERNSRKHCQQWLFHIFNEWGQGRHCVARSGNIWADTNRKTLKTSSNTK